MLLPHAQRDNDIVSIVCNSNGAQFLIASMYFLNIFLILFTEIIITRVSSNKSFPKNCYEVLREGNTDNGIYIIQRSTSSEVFTVKCNMEVMGGGWTYILNRFDGSQDFFLNYTDYKKGFGTLKGEFWLGLDYLHELSGTEYTELLVELVKRNDEEGYAFYDTFKLGAEYEGYPIEALSGYGGNAGDSLASHLNCRFSTKYHDEDNSVENCAWNFQGGWWYNACYSSQLTGLYYTDLVETGIIWQTYTLQNLKEARMMVRPKNRS